MKRINRPIQSKLEDYGYKPLEKEEDTMLGDIRLVAKYKLRERLRYTLSVQGILGLPTGQTPDINKALNVPAGDGQLDVGATFMADYYYSPVVILNGYAGFEVQLPDTLAMRIPEKVSSSLTPDIDNNVRRDLGDQLLAGFGARYKAFDFTHFQAAYGFRYKGRDSYEGDSYADFRYNWIGRESEQRMHTMQLGVTFSTVDLYKQKRFAAPAEITLAYTSIVSGKNVTKDPLTTLELALFF